MANEYDPLIKGKTYVLYLQCKPMAAEVYKVGEETPLRVIGFREGVYDISASEPPQQLGEKTPQYEEIWWQVKEKYGHFASSE